MDLRLEPPPPDLELPGAGDCALQWIGREPDRMVPTMPPCRMQEGCKFWYWKTEYINLLITRNLIVVRAPVAIIEARDETKDETEGEVTSTSLKLKKKEVCTLKNPQINYEDI
ncbi:Phosphatidylinositol-4-phosphate 5-kinase 2 [Hordeum vulgare]|nr:Phosphatidylinositol-4-phosphate 5-kinase 2 [Hordeum vulgare]